MKIFSPIHLKNLLNMTDLPKLPFLLLFALITACGGFNTGVKKSDTQKVNTVKYGTLVAAEPVKIKTRILRLNLFFKTLFFYKLFFSI